MSDDTQIRELEGDIEQTRNELGQTIQQIEDRLSPSALQEQATGIVQQLADQILRQFESKSEDISRTITEQVNGAVQTATTTKVDQLLSQATSTVGSSVKTAGGELWSRIEQNPSITALAGMAMSFIGSGAGQAQNGSQQGGGQGLIESAKGTLGAVTEQAAGLKESAMGVAGQASGMVDEAKGRLDGMTGDSSSGMNASGGSNTILGGLAAIGLGLLAGLSLPKTEKEQQLIEPVKEKAREQLDSLGLTDPNSEAGVVEQLKETGGELLTSAKESGAQAVTAAKQTATEMGQSTMDSVNEARGQGNDSPSPS